MWKCHAVYESRPRSVVVTLVGQLYWIAETVAPAIVSQGRKISSHTKMLSLFSIVSKGEHHITETSTPFSHDTFAHHTQEENRVWLLINNISTIMLEKNPRFHDQNNHINK